MAWPEADAADKLPGRIGAGSSRLRPPPAAKAIGMLMRASRPIRPGRRGEVPCDQMLRRRVRSEDLHGRQRLAVKLPCRRLVVGKSLAALATRAQRSFGHVTPHSRTHGFYMAFGLDQQKRAVDSGVWPVYRFDPRRIDMGEPPLVVDMPGGKIPVQDYMRNEARFRMVERMDPQRFRDFARRSQLAADRNLPASGNVASSETSPGCRRDRNCCERRRDRDTRRGGSGEKQAERADHFKGVVG